MSKKIILTGPAYPFRGGLAAYNERLARELMDQGNEVEIYNFKLQYPGIFFPGKTQYADCPPPPDLNIINKINSINPFNWLKTAREIRKKDPDLLIVRYWMPFFAPCFGTILRKVKKNKKISIISIVDNLIPHEKRPGDNFLTKYFIKPVDGFISMSSSVTKDIRKMTNKPLEYCPHPLFDDFGELNDKKSAKKKLGLSTDHNYILFFGLIRKYKGLDLLLKAMCTPEVKNLSLKLIVAGEFYINKDPYLKIVTENSLEEHVTILDRFIPNQEVADYFNMADLVVLPYKSATQSGVTQIAFHFEKPMVVTNVGGLAEIVPDGIAGYVIEPDANEIVQAITDFYRNNKQEKFRAGIKDLKDQYSWDRLVKTIFRLTKRNGEIADEI